jgi:hypothetical protein
VRQNELLHADDSKRCQNGYLNVLDIKAFMVILQSITTSEPSIRGNRIDQSIRNPHLTPEPITEETGVNSLLQVGVTR